MQLRDLFEEFPLNGNAVVPLELQQLLREPLDVMVDWQRAEQLLLDARVQLPDCHEITVALYKMYAYSNKFDQALELINTVLAKCSAELAIGDSWQLLTVDSIDWQQAIGARRFYLYSLKAMGFVLLRKGELQASLAALSKLQQLDPLDQVGGSVVLEMVERILDEDGELGHVA